MSLTGVSFSVVQIRNDLKKWKTEINPVKFTYPFHMKQSSVRKVQR